MKTAVIYASKTGFTKKYAEWISEELTADMFELSEISIDKLVNYDTIIFGGGLYAVGINGINIITKNFEKLKDKKIVVFATGVSPSREEAIIEIKNKNLPGEMQKSIKYFYLRGGFEYRRLKSLDKLLMTLLKWKISAKKILRMKLIPDERGMLAAYDVPLDFTRRKNIRALVNYVRFKDSSAS
ncbi:MAG: flavodoxin domain-containing protein [Anaerobacillus sp.]|uniref:flavodoxin domain-containing protein n=1 Tax=Anaerobacillus sp. TaxID=1872506 RepID=UPI00391AEAF2